MKNLRNLLGARLLLLTMMISISVINYRCEDDPPPAKTPAVQPCPAGEQRSTPTSPCKKIKTTDYTKNNTNDSPTTETTTTYSGNVYPLAVRHFALSFPLSVQKWTFSGISPDDSTLSNPLSGSGGSTGPATLVEGEESELDVPRTDEYDTSLSVYDLENFKDWNDDTQVNDTQMLAEWAALNPKTDIDCIKKLNSVSLIATFGDLTTGDNKAAHDKWKANYSSWPTTEVATKTQMIENAKVYIKDYFILKKRLKSFLDIIRCEVARIPLEGAVDKEMDYKAAWQEWFDPAKVTSDTTETSESTDSLKKAELISLEENNNNTGDNQDTDTDTETPAATSTAATGSPQGGSVTVKRLDLGYYGQIRFQNLKKDIAPAESYQMIMEFTYPTLDGETHFKINSVTKHSPKIVKGSVAIIITNGSKKLLIGYNYYVINKTVGSANMPQTSVELVVVPEAGSANTTEFEQAILGTATSGGSMVSIGKTFIHRYIFSNLSNPLGKYEALYIDNDGGTVHNPIYAFDSKGACASMQIIGGSFSPQRECMVKDGNDYLTSMPLQAGTLSHAVPILVHRVNLFPDFFDEIPDTKGKYQFDMNNPSYQSYDINSSQMSKRKDANSDEIDYNTLAGQEDEEGEAPPTGPNGLPDFNFFGTVSEWETYCGGDKVDQFICEGAMKKSHETSVD